MTPSSGHGAEGVGMADTASVGLVRTESSTGGFYVLVSLCCPLLTHVDSWVSGEGRANSSKPQDLSGPGFAFCALEA